MEKGNPYFTLLPKFIKQGWELYERRVIGLRSRDKGQGTRDRWTREE